MPAHKHLEIMSNGFGAPSMYLLYMAAQGHIPARISITADTGAEEDRLWSTGRRSTAAAFFHEIVEPLAKEAGIEAYFVRAHDKHGKPMPSLWEHTEQMIAAGRLNHIKMPLFGSRGGRLRQACTSRWKIAAVRQQARRLGATTIRTALGIHRGEALRRMKGANRRFENGWWTYDDVDGVRPDGQPKIVRWCQRYYPLVERYRYRDDIRDELDRLKIPFLYTSECDCCPHQDLGRWLIRSPERLAAVAQLESHMQGQFFFSEHRVPILDAIPLMQAQRRPPGQGILLDEPDFGCANAVCGV